MKYKKNQIILYLFFSLINFFKGIKLIIIKIKYRSISLIFYYKSLKLNNKNMENK